MKKYLPSKKFTIITSVIFAVVLVSWGALTAIEHFSQKTPVGENLATVSISDLSADSKMTLDDLVKKDSNGNNIPDWEEELWGLDPASKLAPNGMTNAEWIANKKKTSGITSAEEGQDSTKPLSETEKFSKEFFATVSALRQTGNLDESAIANIGNVVGDKITNTNLQENYRLTDMQKTYDVSAESQKKYYDDVSESFAKWGEEGLGGEFGSIDLSTGEVDALGLLKIAEAYQGFSKEILNSSVPNNLMNLSLSIANSAYNVGEALKNIAKMKEDPLSGLIGLSQYQKYSEELIKSSNELRTFLIDNDIIQG